MFEASGLIIDRAPGAMQGWFRMPHDSIAGRWWSLIMHMTDADMRLLSSFRLRVNRVRIPDEVGEVQWDPWVGENEPLEHVGASDPG